MAANTPLSARPRKRGPGVREMAVFAMFGALMYASKEIMAVLPNIHLLGMFTMLLTVVYRSRALYPIYVYALLEGLTWGFPTWWPPHLYVWTVLWGLTMLLPRNMPDRAAMIAYPALCALHGLAYGTLYAPWQALAFGLSWDGMLAWIIAGLPFDAVHAAGNLAAGLLILPFSRLLRRLNRRIGIE